MDIKSTMIKNRSTDGGNHSTTGSNQSIAHSESPIKHPVAPRGNPGKIAIKPEVSYDNNGAKGKPGGNGVPMGSFQPSVARSEPIVKHPNKKHDPAMCRC